MEMNRIMYGVGIACRAVYRDGIMPDNIAATVVVQPAKVLGMILASQEARRADQDRLSSALSEIPADLFEKGAAGVPEEAQSFFWLGFYRTGREVVRRVVRLDPGSAEKREEES